VGDGRWEVGGSGLWARFLSGQQQTLYGAAAWYTAAKKPSRKDTCVIGDEKIPGLKERRQLTNRGVNYCRGASI
jgi:hypothetical protein